MKKVFLFIIAVCAVFSFAVVYAEDNVSGEGVAPGEDNVSAEDAAYASAEQAVYHGKYMDHSGDSRFMPDAYITRAEAAKVLSAFIPEDYDGSAEFLDVPADAWYYEYASRIAAYGALDGYEGYFRPEENLSRAELAFAVDFLGGLEDADVDFPDVEEGHWAEQSISNVAAAGIMSGGENGEFNVYGGVTRAETAAVVNRFTGRTPDLNAIATNENIRIFPDVPTDHWAYADIIEATVSHTCVSDESGETWIEVTAEPCGLADGFYIFGGNLYCVNGETGQFRKNETVGVYDFGGDGQYTTGSEELDAAFDEVMDEYFTDDIIGLDRLRLVYNYVRDNFTYQVRAHVERGATGWELEYALPTMRTHRGNCYSFASVFMYLARRSGFPAIAYSGAVGIYVADHAFNEITIDGNTYIFDPELEYSGSYNHQSFFMITNGYPRYYKYN